MGAVAPSEQKQNRKPPLGRSAQAQKDSAAGLGKKPHKGRRCLLRVTFIANTHQRIDSDNLDYKPLRDVIARWFELDDNDDVIEWNYGQTRCGGDEGTIVRIEAA